MLGHLYSEQVCSAARALEVVGERWSLLIVRNALFAGMTRFNDFQRSLGIAPNILAKRLETFVSAGLMSVSAGEYVLTDKGRDLKPVIMALTEWGDRWAAPDGPPVTYVHDDCDGPVELTTSCRDCGQSPPVDDVVARVADWARARQYGSAYAAS